LLGPLERPALQWLAAHMPPWMNPDILTIIGILGAFVVCISYGLTNYNSAFLWVATLGFIINWFGDSLDGTLARYRKIERPKYGYFVDHTVDAFSQLLMFGGLGISPYVRLDFALLALVGYYLVSVLVYVETYVSGLFKISYGKLGPTEIRAIAILANTALFFIGVRVVELPILGGLSMTYMDLVVLGIALILMTIFLSTTTRRAIALARMGE
jgi:phosphatidylglycerophosphate synthase